MVSDEHSCSPRRHLDCPISSQFGPTKARCGSHTLERRKAVRSDPTAGDGLSGKGRRPADREGRGVPFPFELSNNFPLVSVVVPPSAAGCLRLPVPAEALALRLLPFFPRFPQFSCRMVLRERPKP